MIVGAIFSVVTVGFADPVMLGSSVNTLLKLLPETVPWLEIEQSPNGNGLSIFTLNTIVIFLSCGKRNPDIPPTVTVSPDKTIAIGGSSLFSSFSFENSLTLLTSEIFSEFTREPRSALLLGNSKSANSTWVSPWLSRVRASSSIFDVNG